MNRKILVGAILLALTSVANATDKHNTVNNYDNRKYTTTNNTDNSVKNTAYGGQGGSAYAKGGDAKSHSSSNSVSGVVGSGNSKVDNTNVNLVRGSTIEKGAVQSSNKNENNSSAVAGAVGITGGDFGGSASQSQSANASADNSGNNVGSGNETVVNVGGDVHQARRIPVNSPFSPALTSGLDTCLGSTSVGGTTAIFGLSFGKTTIDEGCKLRKETNLLRSYGGNDFERAACFRMSQGREGREIKKALDAAGIDCSKIEVQGDLAINPLVVSEPVTKEYVQESVDRAFKKSVSK